MAGFDPAARMDDPARRPDPAVAREGWEAACQVGELMRRSGMVSKVWFWGSLLIKDEFHPGSDIDMHISWRAGADQDPLLEHCEDIARPFPVQLSVRNRGKRPISHPIVRYRSPDQPFLPSRIAINRRLRLLQDRFDSRARNLRRTLKEFQHERPALARNGRGDLIPHYDGFVWHSLREAVLHWCRKVLWTVDREPTWKMSEPERLLAAARDIPGLRPAVVTPELFQICLPEHFSEVTGDLESAIRAAIAQGEKYSQFLASYIDPRGLRDR